MRARQPPLALTQGDPSGIGPELAIAAYEFARSHPDMPSFVLLADPDLMRRTARALGGDVDIVECACVDAAAIFPTALPVIPLAASARGVPGAPDVADAAATIESIERAVALVFAGEACAVVTNPISKDILYRGGFAHPGHTEFLGALAARQTKVDAQPVMMLWSDELAVVPVTIHVPLRDVSRLLTRELIVYTGKVVAADMRDRFGLASPKLAFSGLNPHAGEKGGIGREEIDVIAPAVADLVAMGIDASGPVPADSMFHPQSRAKYDAAICMTHDQALIPIKTIAFERAVNVTLGLPFVRTSPDHGTAFDIAGRGVANAASLIESLKLAARISRTARS